MSTPYIDPTSEPRSIASDCPPVHLTQLPDDPAIWESLKQAIAASSGFQRWQLERNFDLTAAEPPLDARVRRYLRETLETLAY